jgi:UDP-3-O-[3-hydroxymyristoyl] N-acetylglucosamine deacetylase
MLCQVELVQRCALRPQKPVVVRQDDAFVMLMPEETMRLTVGIDHKGHEVIGKQWMSWCLFEDAHYRLEMAGARQYYESPEEVGEVQPYLLHHEDGRAI